VDLGKQGVYPSYIRVGLRLSWEYENEHGFLRIAFADSLSIRQVRPSFDTLDAANRS
jgi:hypothetical protein